MRAHAKTIAFLGLFGWASVGNAQPPMFVSPPPGQGLDRLPQQAENAVVWNGEVFQLPARHRLIVRVPGRPPLVLRHDRTIEHASGNKTWVGSLDGAGKRYRAVITVSGGAPLGSIDTPEGRIELRRRGGFSILADTATESGIPVAFGDDAVIPPTAEGALLSPIQSRALVPRAGTGPTVVDILILYNTGMVNLYGDVEALIDYLVVLSNTAYEDSGVNMAIRVVYRQQISYEDTIDNYTALTSDFAPNTGIFSNVESLRTGYGADLAVLLRPYDSSFHGSCGIAYLLGSGGSGFSVRNGYAVVSYGKDPPFPEPRQGYSYCSDYTLAHELGHNMGSAHDRDHASVDGHFDYSYGYGNDGDPEVSNEPDDFGTVMSYYFPQVGLFSTPDLSCTTNFLCGVDEAAADSAHNVLSLNGTRETIAAFKPTVVTEPARDKTLFYFQTAILPSL